MPPVRGQQRGHRWTEFEMRSMLCLIVKGVHLEGHDRGTKNVYLDFATQMNEALNGTRSEGDIQKKEITRMLDKILVEHKHVLGKGGLAERQFGNRVTRSLWMAFKRSLDHPYLDFDGSVAEWIQWRRKKVLGVVNEADNDTAITQGLVSPDIRPKTSRPQTRDPGRENRWRSNQQNAISTEFLEDTPATGNANPFPQTGGHDSFNALPTKLRSAPRFQWAKPGNTSKIFPTFKEFQQAEAAAAAAQQYAYYSAAPEAQAGIAAPVSTYRDKRREISGAHPEKTANRARKEGYGSGSSGEEDIDAGAGISINTPTSAPQHMELDVFLERSMSPPTAVGGVIVRKGAGGEELEEGEIEM